MSTTSRLAVILFLVLLSIALTAQTTFDYTGGNQTYAVPADGTLTFTVRGADGGNSNDLNNAGGQGATILASVDVDAGDNVLIVVGESGKNAGTVGGGGGGTGIIISDAGGAVHFVSIAAGGSGGQQRPGLGGDAADGAVAAGGQTGDYDGSGGGGLGFAGATNSEGGNSTGGGAGTLTGGGTGGLAGELGGGGGFGMGGGGGGDTPSGSLDGGGGGGGYTGGDSGEPANPARSTIDPDGYDITRTDGIDGGGTNADGSVIISFTPNPAPVNDDFADALTVAPLPYTHTVIGEEVEGATLETDEQICDAAENSWWYAFTPAVSSRYRVIAESTTATERLDENDVKLGLYTLVGTDLVEALCLDNDEGAGDGENEQLSLNAGTTYFFRVAVDPVPGMDDITFSVSTPAAVWTGTTDTDWYKASNWATGEAPAENDEVYIGPGLTNYPVVANTPEFGAPPIGYLHVNGGTLTVADGGLLAITSVADGILVDNNATLAIDGLVFVSAAYNAVVIGSSATLTVTGNFGLGILEAGGIGLVIAGTATVEANMLIASQGRDGIFLAGGSLLIEETGDVTVGELPEDGVYLQDDATLTVNGRLSVIGTGEDGLDSSDGRVIVGPTGRIELQDNAGFGFDDANFFNEGTILIERSGMDGMFVSEDSRNEGRLEITGSASDGIDISSSAILTNADTIIVNTAGEFAIEDGTFLQESTGTLLVDGAVEVLSLAAGSVLAPGSSPGCVTFAEDQNLSEVVLQIEVDGLGSCTDHDRITAEGTLNLSNAVLELSGGYVASVGEEITVIDKTSAGSVSGMFAGLPEGGLLSFNGVSYLISYAGGDGNDVTLVAEELLPVVLTSFTGRTDTKHNLLEWETTLEEDFSHYEVLRSADGARNWALLGVVVRDSVGTVEGTRSYAWTDETPLPAAYYRLRSVDLDGSFSLSEVVYLERVNANQLQVFPNPTTGIVTISLPTTATFTVNLYDLNGTLLQSAPASGGRLEQRLDLPAGVYLLVVTSASERWTSRVVVR